MQHVRRRCARALIVVLAAGVLTPFTAAEAAVPPPGPVAIGQATKDDPHVLAVDTETVGSRVKVRPYQVGHPADVKAQRWRFEVVTPGAAPVYRIRHASSGLCLQTMAAADNAGVALADCDSTNPQLWTTGTARMVPTGGFELRNKRDGRCLDLNASTNNAPAAMWKCSVYYATRMWRIRVGSFDCPGRKTVAVCVRTSGLISGVMGAWQQLPMRLNVPSPTVPDGNTLVNQVNWNPVTSSGDNPGFDYVEMGWRGSYRVSEIIPSYTAYWLEQGGGTEEFHAIVAVDSTLPHDSIMHTWMSLGNSDGQWDMFYDFNPVGTTRFASGAHTRELQYGLLHQYTPNTALDKGFENRVQMLDATEVWRRPRLGEVAAFPANVCGQPDPQSLTYEEPNTPPYCFTTSLVTRASSTTPSVAEVDRFEVGKPGVDTLAAISSGPPAPLATGVHNGVDQRALAACMAADATACLATVPGLADCVRARQVCNTTGRATAAAERGTPVTADAARQRARAAVGDRRAAAGVRTTTLTAADFVRRTGTTLDPLDGTATVHVVTSDNPATGLTREADRTYAGYTLAYQAATGRLLYACLGDNCARKEFA